MDDNLHGIVQPDNFAEGATPEMTMPQVMPEMAPPAGASAEKKKPSRLPEVTKRFSNILPTVFVDYLKNLDPRGKDKLWWAGTTLSAGLSAYLAIQTGGSSVLMKSIATAATSFGIHMGERRLFAMREKSIKNNYTGENRAQRIATLQEKHRKGTDRIKRFFGGMSAGTVYGGLTGTFLNSGVDAIQSAIDKKAIGIQYPNMSPDIQDKILNHEVPSAFNNQGNIDKLQLIGEHYVDTAKDAVTGTASTIASETSQTVGEVQSAITTGINESLNPQSVTPPTPDLASMAPQTITEITADSVKTNVLQPDQVPGGILPASEFPTAETNQQFVGTIPDVTQMTPNAVTEITADATNTTVLKPENVPGGVLPASAFTPAETVNTPFDNTIKPAPNLSPETTDTIKAVSRNSTGFVNKIISPIKNLFS